MLIKNLIFKEERVKQFRKIAVGNDLNWHQNLMEIKDLLMDAEVKSFRIENSLNAIIWIAK